MFRHELYKILCNKVSAAFIVIILLTNALQLIWVEDNRYMYPASAYREIWSDIEVKSDDTIDGWQTVLEELKVKYQLMRRTPYEEWETFYAEYTGYIWREQALYEKAISEIESSLGYKEYLEGIEAVKMRFDAMGGVVDKEDYVYRNLVRTAEIYANIEAVTLIPESPAGIKMISDSDVTDLLALTLFLFFGVTAWLKEKEQKMLNLIRTARNGRGRLAMAKLEALIVACILCGVALYISNIMIAGAFYGLGDLSRPLASVDIYRGTLWQISVGEFLAFNLLFKLISYIWLALLFSVICTAVSGSLAAFGITALMTAGSYMMYTKISARSVFAVLKYLNPFGMIKTELLFKEYRGLNFFGYPFDYRKCVTVALAVGCVIFAVLTFKLFVREPFGATARRKLRLNGRLALQAVAFRRKLEMHVSIAGHEFYRIFIAGGILIVIVIAFVIQTASYQKYRVGYVNLSEYYKRQYLEYLSGPVTEEKILFIEAEMDKLKRPANDAEKEQKKAINEISGSRVHYLQENKGTYFVYDEPFGLLTKTDWQNDDLKHAVIFMVLLTLTMPAFFAPDWQTGMQRVVAATHHGRKGLVKVRYIMGTVLTLVLFVSTYLPLLWQTASSYEMVPETFSYPAGSLPHLEAYGTSVNIGTYLIVLYTLRFVAGILVMLFIYKISAFIKSHIYTMTAAAAILLVPVLMAYLDGALESAVYPYSALAGNIFLQNTTAAIICVITVLAISIVLLIAGRRHKCNGA
ncbi:MAG: hypothetical protein J6B39_08345 [Lachnospiraceae bacterium]|nr:hypothetical protein [Lachnospiraceae bacterium]